MTHLKVENLTAVVFRHQCVEKRQNIFDSENWNRQAFLTLGVCVRGVGELFKRKGRIGYLIWNS